MIIESFNGYFFFFSGHPRRRPKRPRISFDGNKDGLATKVVKIPIIGLIDLLQAHASGRWKIHGLQWKSRVYSEGCNDTATRRPHFPSEREINRVSDKKCYLASSGSDKWEIRELRTSKLGRLDIAWCALRSVCVGVCGKRGWCVRVKSGKSGEKSSALKNHQHTTWDQIIITVRTRSVLK